MKDILDVVVVILFVFMLIMFLKGFNKQQIAKHTKKLEENEKRMNSKKDTANE
ncbi:MAG: hypothetical protein WBF48_12330 [Halarcobacter sp.]